MSANVHHPADSGRQNRRIGDAAGAIASLCDVFTHDQVTFFKSLDNLLIGIGEPANLRVTIAGCDRAFETGSGSNVEVGRPLDPFHCRLRVQVIVRKKDGKGTEIASDFIEQVGKILLERHAGNLEQLGLALENGFKQVSLEQEASSYTDAIAGVSADEAAKALAPVFASLEPFLLAHNHRFHLQHKPDQCRFLFFHQYIGERGMPELRLHPLRSQRDAFNAAGLENPESLFSKVFAPSNWLLDERFKTGVSAWIDWPWQRSQDETFRRAERAISNILFASQEEDWEATLGSALAIPVHVDGLPWLALAGMFGLEEEAASLWAQRFYRDLLPYLTTTIRAGAEKAYLRAIRRTARAAAGCVGESAMLITEKLAPLAATFPFKRVVASFAASEPTQSIDWNGGARLGLELADIETEARRVEYGRLDRSSILEAFRDGRNEAEAQRAQRLEAQLLTYMDVGHTLKNVVECTGWAVSAETVGRTANYFEKMVEAGLQPTDMEKIGEALGFADRSLSLFWIMSSLGHFIRLSGAHTGSYGWGKFSDWLGPDDAPAESTSLEPSYMHAVTQIATALAYGNGWSSVLISNHDGTDRRNWAGEPPNPLDITKFCLPPFRKGADVGYVFAFCLLEPLINAIRAVGALPSELLTDAAFPPLEILVSTDEIEGRVDISIFNLSHKRLPPTFSGLRSTKAIATDIGLATFAVPIEHKLAPALYRITSGLSFHPRHIHEAISRAGGPT